DGRDPASQQRHPVPAVLAMPDRAIARRLDLRRRERLVPRLQLLQRDHVRLLALQPQQQVRQPRADAVDVEGGQLQYAWLAAGHGRLRGSLAWMVPSTKLGRARLATSEAWG